MAAQDLGRVLPAERKAATDEYWGEKLDDPFQYLESPKDAETERWTAEQAGRAASFLSALPGHGHFSSELERIVLFEAPTYMDVKLRREAGAKLFFAQKRLPPNPQPLIVCFDAVEGESITDRVLFNPTAAEGVPAVDWMVPSPGGTLLAMCLSFGGTENGDVHIMNVESGELIAGEVTKHANTPTAGGSLAWVDDESFYYTRHPHEGEKPEEDRGFFQKIFFHRVGSPNAEDVHCVGETFPRIAECELLRGPECRHCACFCADGDGGEYAVYVSVGGHPCQEAAGGWRYISGFKDGVKNSGAFSDDGSRLFLLSKHGAPMGKIVALECGALAGCSADLTAPNLDLLSVLVPESPDAAIDDFIATRSRLYVNCVVGGPSTVKVFDAATGAALQAFPTPEAHMIFGMIGLPSSESGDDIYFSSTGFTAPRAMQRFSAATGQATRTALVQESPVETSDIEAVRVFATSKDGTQVPMTIIRKKGLPEGPKPCNLYAYGGYGIVLVPRFVASLKPWLDLGGLYVEANIRGGGEYGERWHLEGNLTVKQNVFDDFIACAEKLVADGYTTRDALCIEGGSNGGLLMGAVMTQRPDLFRAVVAHVGIFDSLRTELEPNGVFNIPEFGSVKDEAQYRALRAYSPYHNLPAPGTVMPSLLLTTGENDGRVASWQSKKFAAALEPVYAQLPPERHLVLRVSVDTGHGMGTPLQKKVAELADTWAFIAAELGVDAAASKM